MWCSTHHSLHEYERPLYIHVLCVLPFRYNGWYGGYQVGYNTSNAKLTANNVAVGYQGTDFTVNTKL